MFNENYFKYLKDTSTKSTIGSVKDLIELINKNNIKSVLEVGCGRGDLLRYIKNNTDIEIIKGIDIHNLDMNDIFYQKINILDSNDFNKIKKEQYDLIISINVLEHIHNPFDFVSRMKKILNKNGYLYLVAPSFKSLWMPDSMNFYGDYTHIRPFSQKGMKRLLMDNNMKILAISSGSNLIKRIFGIPYDILRFVFSFKSLYLAVAWGRVINYGVVKCIAKKI
jgi:2-polyprenyl-3-methyl-5-hydroxy-6-metoxy-1,4-benzoquinol methylase